MTDLTARQFFGGDNFNKREIRGINGWYYWEPQGRALIVDSRGHALAATSRVSPREHLEEFCRRFR